MSIETRINDLFKKLEQAAGASEHFNLKSLFGQGGIPREVYGRVFEETLLEIAVIQKRIIRALLQAGMVGELTGHMEAGTFPPYAIHRALNRREVG
jgi:hypothetical protein